MVSIFRATAVAWAAAKYPAHATGFMSSALKAGHADADASAFAAFVADASAFAAFVAASAAAAAASYASADASAAADAAAAAAAAAASFAADDYAADADSQAIENGIRASTLAGRRLWPKRPPSILKAWSTLKAELLTRPNEHWEVWTDWYDARLRGRPAIEALEIARVMIGDDIWRQGPAVVNSEIKALIERLTPISPEVATAALKQRPAAFKFRVQGDKIDLAPNDAAATDRDTAVDVYEETKRKAHDLRDRLDRIQADAPLRKHVALLIKRLGADFDALRPGLILGVLRSLQSDVRAYDTDEGRKELSAGDLSLVLDLTESTRDLAGSFPSVREIEAENVALDLPLDRLDEVAGSIGEIIEVVARSDGATDATKTAIQESTAAIPDARSPIDRAKQIAYASLDIGNFLRTGFGYVRVSGKTLANSLVGRATGKMVGELGGLGSDSWRGIRKGLPQGVESGARIVGKASIVGGAAALMGHLVGPTAAIGTIIASFAPLGKIAGELVAHADGGDPDGEALDPPDEAESEIGPLRAGRKVRPRRSRKKPG